MPVADSQVSDRQISNVVRRRFITAQQVIGAQASRFDVSTRRQATCLAGTRPRGDPARNILGRSQ